MAIGQHFSQEFGYAIHALAYFAAKRSDELTTLPELSIWMRTLWPNASQTFLSIVLQRMRRGGLLRSQRGVAGGYSLARPAEKITLWDVVELFEAVDIDRCGHSHGGDRGVAQRDAINRRLSDLAAGYFESLESVSLADIAEDVDVPRKRKTRKK